MFYFCILEHVREITGHVLYGHFPLTEACILSSTVLACQTQNYHQNALPYKPLALLFQLLSPYYHPNHRHPMQAITVAHLHNMSVNKSRMKARRLQDAQEVSTLIS